MRRLSQGFYYRWSYQPILMGVACSRLIELQLWCAAGFRLLLAKKWHPKTSLCLKSMTACTLLNQAVGELWQTT